MLVLGLGLVLVMIYVYVLMLVSVSVSVSVPVSELAAPGTDRESFLLLLSGLAWYRFLRPSDPSGCFCLRGMMCGPSGY